MAKNLVIVESPAKSKTIEKYLGKDYKVVSSMGHVRDLATTGKFGFGIDVENDFKPNYVPIKGKKKTITDLTKQGINHEKVILATDPDREGEAISWHLKDAMDIPEEKYERVVFHEITKDKIIEAFAHPRKIDDNLVRSQETRRMLDRIIGFRLSKLMQSKTGGKSAGRVQSVALKLIVDREREIQAFIPEEYWEIVANFPDFEAKLEKYGTKKIEVKTENEANEILDKLSKAFKIESVDKKETSKQPYMPFITSTLQQEASSKYGFPAKKTMSLAQKLYEGIELESETVGLITYMRTDSNRLSDQFVNETLNYIEGKYGKEYLGRARVSKKKDNVQDAHEAIRPTSVNRTPESIKTYLKEDEYKLYKLIYARAVASLMAPAKYDATTVVLDNANYKFKATGQVLKFEGYLKTYKEFIKSEDKLLPAFENYHSNTISATKVEKSQHFTKPKSRYTEAKLIKELEELGIGRPSTYAKIIDTLKERAYVTLEEKKFKPTEVGITTTDALQDYFSNIINVEYTAGMETDLDKIAEGDEDWLKLMHKFYDEFTPMVDNAYDKMEKKEPEKTGEACPNCGHDLVIRNGRYGAFVACSNYPECKYIKQDETKIKEICDCPDCDGKIVEKKTRKGKIFYGCNNYPKCKNAYWDEPTGEVCPECGKMLTKKSKKIKCSGCNYEK